MQEDQNTGQEYPSWKQEQHLAVQGAGPHRRVEVGRQLLLGEVVQHRTVGEQEWEQLGDARREEDHLPGEWTVFNCKGYKQLIGQWATLVTCVD